MDLRQLTYFVRVAEMKSFTKAAGVLYVAQPALGFQIRKLEDELQVQLLNRHSRGVEPTEAGLLLLEHARALLSAAETAKRLVMDYEGPERGLVNLGVPPGHPLTSEAIIRTRREFPQIVLNVVEDYANAIIEQIAANSLDLGCIYTDIDKKLSVPGLTFEPLTEDHLCLIGSKRTMGKELGPIAFADVAAHPLVLAREPWGIRQRMDGVAESLGLTLDIAFQIHSEPLVSRLIDEGEVFAIKPSALVRHQIDNNRFAARQIVEPMLRSRLHLVYSDRHPVSKASRAMRRMIRALASEDTEGA
jgi:LysR family nitrogen assimilation transcriptional regulator